MAKIKTFSSFYKMNENVEDSLIDTPEIREEVKGIIDRSTENIRNGVKENDFESFKEQIEEGIVVDATNMVDIDITKELDLCIYAEKVGFIDEKCPSVEWELLDQTITNNAIQGLIAAVNETLQELFEDVKSFMEKHNLDYTNMSDQDRYSMMPPDQVKDIANGSVYLFKNVDNSGKDIENYVYKNDELGVTLYIDKK